MIKPELKPCPFCGGKAKIDEVSIFCVGSAFRVSCLRCNTVAHVFPTKERAAEAWNNRTPHWISVKDRLPEEVDGGSKPVLAIVKFVDFDRNVWSNNYIIAWTEHGEWGCRGIVTHWMPIPEPPEMENETNET